MEAATAARPGRRDPIPLFYWDKKRNFGDLLGPWLVECFTGRPTFNVRGRRDGPALATVGSIVAMFDRPGLHVWGSGLMAPLDVETVARLRRFPPRTIHAVRGWRTYRELTVKLGWATPKIYGDPALLLPRFYEPTALPERRIAVCPHFAHRSLFEIGDVAVDVIDVAEDARSVVDRIAGARVCVSSSLHGIIVAQAYGVPWVWLGIQGRKLGGTNFKFEDFFTVLDRSAVQAAVLAPEDCTAETLGALAQTATLPRSKFSFDDLYDAFPNGAF